MKATPMENRPVRDPDDARLSAKEFRRLSEFIYAECGIKMPDSKKIMLEARLGKRLRKLDMRSFEEYCDFLFSPAGLPRELVNMIDVITTNKTDFFREPQHFDYLVRTAIPPIIGSSPRDMRRKLVFWSAGCSTGEEPYTLAMVLSEFSEQSPGFRFSILATDISTRVLEKARLAVYEEEKVEPIPARLRKKYLLRSKDPAKKLMRVAPEVRELVEFRRMNFMEKDFGFTEGMDVIFCRNVIIYFDRPTQQALLNRLCRYLNPGGYVFLGHSETLHGMNVPLVSVAPTIYRKQS